MRKLVSFIILFALSGSAYASKTVSGVVAVSTGPMQAFTQSVGRSLTAGDDVFMNDQVETGEATRAQVLLRDESVFSLAPASKIIFDEFVYDPTVGEGSIQANLMQGGLRFVSGQLSKNQPENIKIKAGKATVGIRGTEIMAKHGAQGSTFVLLSGEMQIATDSGTQVVNRPGFGIDVSTDGMLGVVRPVPLSEINALLAPPAEQEEGQSEENGEPSDDAEQESEGEETASDAEGEGDNVDAEASADSQSETETEEQNTDTVDTTPAQSDDSGDEESSFDAALTASVASSDGDGEAPVGGLADMTTQTSSDTLDSSPEMSIAEPTEAEATVQVDITETVVASVVENLAEDEQKETADLINSEANITLTLNTTDTLTANPYFSSSANLLVRSGNYFNDAPSQFNVTHALIQEKFPDSFDESGFINHTQRQTSGVDLTGYDAIFVYLGTDDAQHDFTQAEVAAYRSFIHDDGKKVLAIGRQEQNMGTINSAMAIYHNGIDGYQYTGSTSNDNQPQLLSPVEESNSEILLGVTSFPQYYDSSGFQRTNFSKDLVSDNADTPVAVTNGLLTNSYNDFPALDFGDKGAIFFGRWSCGANGSTNGFLGASIDANFVNNGREQFCRNLISSIAPDDSLVDVEVGTLSVSGDVQTANYRIIDGGDDNFKIIGDKLILDKSASLVTGSYDLTIGVTPLGSDELERVISVAVSNSGAEKRIIGARDIYRVGDTVSFSTANLVSHTYSLQDISWVSIDGAMGGGEPTNTGTITLHYRVSENGNTYDRFHEIEVVHDCQSDHCDAFATSMDTESEFIFNRHFNDAAKSNWSSFFDRFTSGNVRMQKAYSLSSASDYDESGGQTYLDVLNADYSHSLAINFGTEMGELNTKGTFDGIVNNSNNTADFDVTWNFSFTDSLGPCEASGTCYLKVSEADASSIVHNLQVGELDTDNFPGVGLMNMALPNGKQSILVRSNLASEHANGCDTSSKCRLHETDFQPMTPQ